MDIKFDKRIGEIHDIFNSLWYLNNYEYANKKKKKNKIELNNKIDAKLNKFLVNEKIHTNKLSRYFMQDIPVAKIFSLESMWSNPNLEQYLNFIKGLNDKEIRIKIIEAVDDEETAEEVMEKISSDNDSVLSFIKGKDINSALKWEIFCLLNDSQSYIEEFTQFILKYYEIYQGVEKVRNKLLDKFNSNFESKLEKSGVEFLQKVTKDIFDFTSYKNIYITSSIFTPLTITLEEDPETCYVVIGPDFEKFLERNYGTNNLDNNLNIFKNLSDKTRFLIIKLLMERDYYGQEIARELDITTATVSYHMNFLLLAGLINVERREHKAYYSLNKDRLRSCINFLNSEFEL